MTEPTKAIYDEISRAISRNDVDTCGRLVTQYPSLLTHVNHAGWTYTDVAIERARWESLRCLLDKGAPFIFKEVCRNAFVHVIPEDILQRYLDNVVYVKKQDLNTLIIHDTHFGTMNLLHQTVHGFDDENVGPRMKMVDQLLSYGMNIHHISNHDRKLTAIGHAIRFFHRNACYGLLQRGAVLPQQWSLSMIELDGIVQSYEDMEKLLKRIVTFQLTNLAPVVIIYHFVCSSAPQKKKRRRMMTRLPVEIWRQLHGYIVPL
jgi:hypothetical protein